MVGELVSLIDIAPTLLAACGLEKPLTMPGRPLQELVQAGATDWPEEVFVQTSLDPQPSTGVDLEDHIGRAIRTKRWKYSVWAPVEQTESGCVQPGATTYAEECLYDLDNDPHERRNLVSDAAYSDVRVELCNRLKRHMVAAGEKSPEVRPAGRQKSHVEE